MRTHNGTPNFRTDERRHSDAGPRDRRSRAPRTPGDRERRLRDRRRQNTCEISDLFARHPVAFTLTRRRTPRHQCSQAPQRSVGSDIVGAIGSDYAGLFVDRITPIANIGSNYLQRLTGNGKTIQLSKLSNQFFKKRFDEPTNC